MTSRTIGVLTVTFGAAQQWAPGSAGVD